MNKVSFSTYTKALQPSLNGALPYLLPSLFLSDGGILWDVTARWQSWCRFARITSEEYWKLTTGMRESLPENAKECAKRITQGVAAILHEYWGILSACSSTKKPALQAAASLNYNLSGERGWHTSCAFYYAPRDFLAVECICTYSQTNTY